MSKIDYHEQLSIKNTLKLREIVTTFPNFMNEFFRGISETTTTNTRLVYAYDFRVFFKYLLEYHNEKNYKDINEITLNDLEDLESEVIESYLEYLTYYVNKDNNKVIKNKARGKGRKLASLRTLYRYFIKKRKLKSNPSELVDMPKVRQKNIIRLEKDEVHRLISQVENADKLTNRQKKFHEYTKLRDVAIIILLLGTGLRISELVGINLEHIDFNVDGIKITRKGGNEVIIYFGEEVSEALKAYLIERNEKITLKDHDNALFLSIQNRRITTRAVQNLVKKYSSAILTFKSISPHKLRSTFGTNLYRETRDIYLVADVLGHKDVNTTRKHYAQMDEERRKSVSDYIKIRE